MNAKLTAKETALMAGIARQQHSYFDEGLTEGSGIWSDALTHEVSSEVSTTARGAATVMSSLCRKGLLFSDKGSYSEDDGAWVELTAAGAAWCAEFNGTEAAAAAEAEGVELEVVETELAFEESGSFRTEGELKVHEWTTEGTEDTVSWTEITFPDASRTIKRRQKVSGAWRTDYWGAEFAGDAERLTTSAKVKAAVAAGTFTR